MGTNFNLRHILLLSVCAFSFVACNNKFSFVDTSSSANLSSSSVATNSTTAAVTTSQLVTTIQTDLNTAVIFTLIHESNFLNATSYSFAAANKGVMNGSLTVINTAQFQLKYSPNLGFRGQENIIISVKNASGATQIYSLLINVGNPLSALQPALAVRAMGCIQCHANISANIITDFGYGNDYYFGQKPSANWWNSGAIYGDHINSFNTINIPADKSVFVPNAAAPSNVQMSTGATTLAEYIKKQFQTSSILSTQNASVVEKSSIYIGAPSENDLTKAFNLISSDRYKYFSNSSSSAIGLSGLVDKGSYFKISGNLSCEGDLAIKGPLYIENLNLNTNTGCRLYVIGSVFMYGPLNFATTNSNRNLQIVSTKSVILGLGSVVNADGTVCEANSRYATSPAEYGTSSLQMRLYNQYTTQSYFVRQATDAKAFGGSIVAESQVIENGEGTLHDASCRAEGRNVSFQRFFINAPIVHSRYEGDFSGTIISEIAMMSLGQFVFSFDSVFKTNPILPFIDSKLYLQISQ